MKLHFKLLFAAIALTAQVHAATDFPYACDFEENSYVPSDWVLNYGTPTATDQWMVGTAVHSEGKRSLYISSDSLNARFGSNPNVTVAYLRYKFPTETSSRIYDISFDWKGGCDSTDSKLYVMVCLESELTDENSPYNLNSIVSSTSGILSNVTKNECEKLGDSQATHLCDGERWQNISLHQSVRINSALSAETFAIVFIWANDNMDSSIIGSSIAIDNIQICSAAYLKPWDATVVPQCEDSSLLVTWNGVQSEFEVQYREVGANNWHRLPGITDNPDGFSREGTQCSYVIKGIEEGNSYDVRVRGVVDEETTAYAYAYSTTVFCPGNHCINYIDLEGANTHCTYGYYPNGSYSPYQYVGVVDFGPDAIKSRHTIHIDPTETDPRTNNMLHTVPEGALASVRLGNWEVHSEAESITYDIAVDSANSGILIIRYAVVFQDPSLHRGHDEGLFKLEVLDAEGNIIDPNCGHASFNFSDAVNGKWNTSSDETVLWKDWTTMGINLMDYDGETVQVRLTTMDCGLGAHFGYAYFTLDCASPYINYSNDSSTVTCTAPEGFAYEWTDENGDTLSTERELTVVNNHQVYTCRVISLDDPNCYFSIQAHPVSNTTTIIDDNTSIDSTPITATPAATKYIDNGRMLIQCGDNTYNAQGQKIR